MSKTATINRTKKGYYMYAPEREIKYRAEKTASKYLKLLASIYYKEEYVLKLPDLFTFIENFIPGNSRIKRIENIRAFFRLMLLMDKHDILDLTEKDRKTIQTATNRLKYVKELLND